MKPPLKRGRLVRQYGG